jgi:hypothetical protein
MSTSSAVITLEKLNTSFTGEAVDYEDIAHAKPREEVCLGEVASVHLDPETVVTKGDYVVLKGERREGNIGLVHYVPCPQQRHGFKTQSLHIRECLFSSDLPEDVRSVLKSSKKELFLSDDIVIVSLACIQRLASVDAWHFSSEADEYTVVVSLLLLYVFSRLYFRGTTVETFAECSRH